MSGSYGHALESAVPLDPDDVTRVWVKHSQALLADDGLIAQALGLADYDAPHRDPIYRGKRAMPKRRTSGRNG